MKPQAKATGFVADKIHAVATQQIPCGGYQLSHNFRCVHLQGEIK